MTQLLIVEDDRTQVSGLTEALEDGPSDGPDAISVHAQQFTTLDDTLAFFEQRAGKADGSLAALPVQGILIDNYMPRDRAATVLEPCGVELIIRLTGIYDRAGVHDADRPRAILRTADIDPCEVRAFVTYGGAGAMTKGGRDGDRLREHVLEIVRDRVPWEAPSADLPHGYSPGLTRYLRGFELALPTDKHVAARIGGAPDSVQRIRTKFRELFDLEERTSDVVIVEEAKKRGISWVPLKHEGIAASSGVRPRRGHEMLW